MPKNEDISNLRSKKREYVWRNPTCNDLSIQRAVRNYPKGCQELKTGVPIFAFFGRLLKIAYSVKNRISDQAKRKFVFLRRFTFIWKFDDSQNAASPNRSLRNSSSYL